MGAESRDGNSSSELHEPLMMTTKHLLQERSTYAQDDDPEEGVHSSSSSSSVTAYLLATLAVAYLGAFASTCSDAYTSPVESEMMSDLSLTTSQFSLFGSLLTAGAVVGCLTSGKISDRIGRKATMGLADVISITGWLFIASSQGLWSLYLGRCLVGYGTGIFSFMVPIYISEIVPSKIRGGAILAAGLSLALGTSFMYCAGLVINWRWLALMGSTPSILQIIGLFFVPESPRWLLKIGRGDEYKVVLQRLRGSKVDISHEAAEMKEISNSLQGIPDVNFFDLFQRKYAYALMIVIGLIVLGNLGGVVGLLYYASHIFKSAGLSTTTGSIAMSIIQVLSTIVGFLLTDKVGRRPLLMVSASGMCFGCFLCGVSFLLEDHELLTTFTPYMVLFGLLLFFAVFPFGMTGLPMVIMSEIFPMNAKGSAGSIATMTVWSSAWIVSYAFNFMVDWSSYGTFFIFTCVNACSLLFIVELVPETSRRSLEEIQVQLKASNIC